VMRYCRARVASPATRRYRPGYSNPNPRSEIKLVAIKVYRQS